MMRYRFVDDVLFLDLGARPRIEVAKTFAAGDDAFSGPLGDDCVPNSLVLELLAMTGGHLAFRHGGARRLPLLLKVPECRFEGTARAGDRLRARATLTGTSAVSDDAGNGGSGGRGLRGRRARRDGPAPLPLRGGAGR
jgi:hypothetical protein